MELLKNLEGLSADEQMSAVVELQKAAMKHLEEQKQASIGKSAEMVILGLKKIKSDFEAKFDSLNYDIQTKVANLKDGEQGLQGPKGEQGDRGLDGYQGKDGRDGKDGKDGTDGVDGVGVTDAKIDFDGSLVITLSDGREINVGEVVPVDVAEKIRTVHNIQSGSGGDSQTVLDAIAALQATIATYGTMATQNANNVAITGGTINNTTVGATTPSTGVFTTLTAQNEVLKGTGQNLIQFSEQFNVNSASSGVSVTANTTVAPDGATTADTITSTVNGGSNTCWVDRQAQAVQNTNYVFSVYLKQGTSPTTAVNLWFGGGTYTEAYSLVTWSATPTITVVNGTGTITSVGSGWYRLAISQNSGNNTQANCRVYVRSNGTANVIGDSVIAWGRQLELSSSVGTYIATSASAVYGTPTLSFSGVSTIGLESNGSLFLQPAGTGALQAQATTSTASGGNARGVSAVDWQTARYSAVKVARGQTSVISGGYGISASGSNSTVGGGALNAASGESSFVGGGSVNAAQQQKAVTVGGNSNNSTKDYAAIVGGQGNNATGYFNFIGGGASNTGTANGAVTTQSGTMNATTAVTLSGSNANIKVGQLITGTSIATFTYVAAISGTSLTLSQAASGSSTSTLSFYTPHGVVVGGGNNQATGSYSYIGGGGDAGTAANRNVASGDWSVVGGGRKNTASGIGSFVGSGGTDGTSIFGNTASGTTSTIGGGWNNTANGTLSFIGGGTTHTASGSQSTIAGGQGNTVSGLGSSVLGGYNNTANSTVGAVIGGRNGISRSITGNIVLCASNNPIADAAGLSQSALLVLGRQTTDATATVLASDSNAAGTSNQVILPNNSAYAFRGTVIANVTGGGNTKAWTIEGAIKRGANAASTALVGTPMVTSAYADVGAATWAITATADTTNGGLAITFTGQAATTIRVVAKLETTEVTF